MAVAAIVLALLIAWPVAGYPVALWLITRLVPSRRPAEGPTPASLTVLIPARDEEGEIGAKIEDVLDQRFDGDLEVLVISDASEDGTDDEVRACEDPRVRVLRLEGRRGKTACLNLGVREASGDVVVLTDCGSRLEEGALERIAAPFADPAVGCAGGRVGFRENGGDSLLARAWNLIWNMEHHLRRLESSGAGLVGLSGYLCALRRDGAPEVREDLLDDWTLGPLTVAAGRRCLYVPEAVSRKAPSSGLAEDARRRLRIAVQTLHTLWCTVPQWASPRRPLYFFQVFSHKALRYLTPVLILPLMGAVLAGLRTSGEGPSRLAWSVAAGLMLVLVIVSLLGLLEGVAGLRGTLWPLGYWLYLQAVLLAGWVLWLLGRRVSGWSPERPAGERGDAT